jgi:hypothetical protein
MWVGQREIKYLREREERVSPSSGGVGGGAATGYARPGVAWRSPA